MRLPRIAFAALLTSLAAVAVPGAAEAGRSRAVVVNRVVLKPAEVRALATYFRAPVPAGRYWYDRVSGAWGREGGPMQGRLAPNLPVRGKLWRAASGGRTGVIVNGRELHRRDVQGLAALGIPVRQGRFWLDHRGVGGYEGGPPLFDLSQAFARRGGRRTARQKSVFSTWDLTGVAVYP